jgi:arylsulfatase A-like enzyme
MSSPAPAIIAARPAITAARLMFLGGSFCPSAGILAIMRGGPKVVGCVVLLGGTASLTLGCVQPPDAANAADAVDVSSPSGGVGGGGSSGTGGAGGAGGSLGGSAGGTGGPTNDGGAGTGAVNRPNVVIIYADDLGFGDVAAYGARFGTPSAAPTPHLDTLAAEGLMFTQAHSSNGVCTPSRYALLTGKYNWRTFSDISWSYAAPDIPTSDTTLAEFLKTQGYDTAAFGKWHLGGYFHDRAGVPYTGRAPAITDASMIDWEHPLVGHATDNGFDIFRGLAVTINLPPYVYVKEDRIQYYDPALGAYRDARNTDAYQNFTSDQLDGNLTAGRNSTPGLGDPSYKQIDADPIMLGELESYLGQRATNPAPFFAYVCMYSPHEPWHVTPAFDGAVGFEYGDWMADFDSRIGRILSAIDDNGLRENTLVILTSDNGPEITAFINSRASGRDSNGPLRGIKHDVWEGGTRVPFMVRWPGQISAPGTVTNELIWQGDIFTTVAAYLGADLPVDVAPDGESFLNILRGQSKPSQRRDSIVISSQYDHRAVIRTDGWKLIDSTGGGGIEPSFDSANADIVNAPGTNRGTPKQLFHLPTDLGEDSNAIAGITDVTAIRSNLMLKTGGDLLARLDQYRTTQTSAVFPPFPDNDLDGMPNGFENRYPGLDRENPADAALDLDGDGLTNLEEYRRGTDPTKPDPVSAARAR